MSHALVIGGTGMLRYAVIELLNSFDTVTVLARNKAGYEKLKKAAGKRSTGLNFLQTDYNNYIGLTKSLIKATDEHGGITLAILWIHSTAKLARVITAKVINETSDGCNLYEVSGSLNADEEITGERGKDEFSEFSNINYHIITLGFIIEPSGSRWLLNKEISDGVLFAVRNKIKTHMVGVTKPLEKRP
jgi:hypothetical protein